MVALLSFKKIRGDCCVPLSFVIPDEIPWPDGLVGYELGDACNIMRRPDNKLRVFKEERKEMVLRGMGFTWVPFVDDAKKEELRLEAEQKQVEDENVAWRMRVLKSPSLAFTEEGLARRQRVKLR